MIVSIISSCIARGYRIMLLYFFLNKIDSLCASILYTSIQNKKIAYNTRQNPLKTVLDSADSKKPYSIINLSSYNHYISAFKQFIQSHYLLDQSNLMLSKYIKTQDKHPFIHNKMTFEVVSSSHMDTQQHFNQSLSIDGLLRTNTGHKWDRITDLLHNTLKLSIRRDNLIHLFSPIIYGIRVMLDLSREPPPLQRIDTCLADVFYT